MNRDPAHFDPERDLPLIDLCRSGPRRSDRRSAA
jgi:hypothetical protein